MAAGLGSRFGEGIKQLTKVGPDGEIIMDYSIHDALEAGFDKIVVIIRKDIENDFREIIGNRIEKVADVSYAFQELDMLPHGFSVPAGRKKPWGTAHALIQARPYVDCPFAVINADDYYGKEGFRLLHDYMVHDMNTDPTAPVFDICMAGFIVGNTLSDHGTVSRGVCSMGENGYLAAIHETYEVQKGPDGRIMGQDAKGQAVCVPGDSVVSMNMFGLPEHFLDRLSEGFPKWLSVHGQEMKSEYLLPAEIDAMMQDGRAKVKVLRDPDRWFGVTYQEDKEAVQASLKRLHEAGVYPAKLY